MKVTVLDRQSLLDISVKYSGSLNALFMIALENNLSITEDLEPNQEIKVSEVLNEDIANYMASIIVHPSTALSIEDLAIILSISKCCLCDMFKDGTPLHEPINEYT